MLLVFLFLLLNFVVELKLQNIQVISYQYMNFSSVYSMVINAVLNVPIYFYQHLVKEGLKERLVPAHSCPGVSWKDTSLRHTRNSSYLLVLAVLNALLHYRTQSMSNCFQLNRGSMRAKASPTSLSYCVCREWDVNWKFPQRRNTNVHFHLMDGWFCLYTVVMETVPEGEKIFHLWFMVA